jgi:hypothetical protein
MQPLPLPPFEVIEAKLFFELLVCLFTDPARLDRPGKLLDRRIGRQVGETIFAFAGGAIFADHPDFFAGKMLRSHIVDALGWPVGHTPKSNSKAGREPSFGSLAPADGLPFGIFQYDLCRQRFHIRVTALAWSSPA